MIAAEIAAALGAACRSGDWWRCLCPVHGSRTGRSATLALRDGDRGLIIKCFADCDPRDVLAELRRRGLIAGRGDKARPAPLISRRDNHADVAGRVAMASRLWEAAQDARGSPVARYLASRGITLPPPPSLRWAPRCCHWEARAWLPAMLAAIVNVDGGLIGVHRTFLAPGGSGKADVAPQKAMLGRAAGGAVRLGPAAEMLMIGEGIETCLSAAQATGMPAWAALSTSGLRALVLPPIVREIVILADNDANGAGAAAACDAARRWLSAGRAVRLAMPPDLGDFNDMHVDRLHGTAPCRSVT
jgi:putative DNA primase/helicase